MPSPKRQKGESLLVEWTERLNRFAQATTPQDRQAVLDNALQINPGGTIRSLLEAWGYSASGRGRKAKGDLAAKNAKPARERLEEALKDLFGGARNPVKSLYPKLAGSTEICVGDAIRISAALIMSWPAPLTTLAGLRTAQDRRRRSEATADIFLRELLSAASGGRSLEWTVEEIEARFFKLLDEERIGASQFIREAGEKEGALIVAGAKDILVGGGSVKALREFHKITSQFVQDGNKGLLVFVFNAGFFDVGQDGFRLLYNFGLLSTAVTAFALFEDSQQEAQPFTVGHVDWSRWQTLSSRCAVVMHRPPLIAAETGELLAREDFDDFIANWGPHQDFEKLRPLMGYTSFQSEHVLPATYPHAEENFTGTDLYWDVCIRPDPSGDNTVDISYFIPPQQKLAEASSDEQGDDGQQGNHASRPQAPRGRRPMPMLPIEEDTLYVSRRASPGAEYDRAQLAIYRAVRGRLKLDSGERHRENLNAAAALRQVGYEVLPISIAISMLPRALHFATHRLA